MMCAQAGSATAPSYTLLARMAHQPVAGFVRSRAVVAGYAPEFSRILLHRRSSRSDEMTFLRSRLSLSRPRRNRAGFTLVELVVVVIILGILAAIAAPKLLSTTKNATDSGLKQTLGVVRNAIEMFAADNNGAFPGADGTQATLYSDLQPYLRTNVPFPSSLVGAKNNLVRMQTTGQSLTADNSPTTGWAYDNVSGQFIANCNALSSDGVTAYSNF